MDLATRGSCYQTESKTRDISNQIGSKQAIIGGDIFLYVKKKRNEHHEEIKMRKAAMNVQISVTVHRWWQWCVLYRIEKFSVQK